MEMKNAKTTSSKGHHHDRKRNNTSTTLVTGIPSWLRVTGVVAVILAALLKFATENATLLQLLDRLLTSFQETKHHLANHNYLKGNYGPVTEEHHLVPLELVEGALPSDLDGLFVRNGPNPIPSHMTKRYHWFDGHGMLHNVRIRPGPQPSAIYSNQFIPTPRYEIETKMGRQVFSQIGEFTGLAGVIKAIVMLTGLPKAFGLHPMEAGQANTQTLMYNNRFYCDHETSLPFEVELDDNGRIVKGIGFANFGGALDFPVSAHPKVDHVTGNLLFHGYTSDPALLKKYGSIKVGEYDPEQRKLLYYFGVNPDSQDVFFSHDLLFTKNWMIVNENSVLFDPLKIMVPDAGFFYFNSNKTLRFGLVPRNLATSDGKANHTIAHHDVVWIDTGAPHTLVHALASWEEDDGTVVIWAPIGDDFDGTLNNTTSINVFHMAEIRLDSKARRLVSKTMIDSNLNVEFSRVRDECLGRFCRFGYTGILDQGLGGDAIFSGFTVWDMKKRKLHNMVRFPTGEGGQEPVLIPKPGRAESNAVYVGTFLYNSINKESYFALYDGEGSNRLVAKLRVPHRVPYGFHGQWVTGEQLRAHVTYHASKNRT